MYNINDLNNEFNTTFTQDEIDNLATDVYCEIQALTKGFPTLKEFPDVKKYLEKENNAFRSFIKNNLKRLTTQNDIVSSFFNKRSFVESIARIVYLILSPTLKIEK